MDLLAVGQHHQPEWIFEVAAAAVAEAPAEVEIAALAVVVAEQLSRAEHRKIVVVVVLPTVGQHSPVVVGVVEVLPVIAVVVVAVVVVVRRAIAVAGSIEAVGWLPQVEH